MNNQHVQLPNNVIQDLDLTPKDLLVYVTIRSFMNNETRQCFPSINTIVKKSGISKGTVIKSINTLRNKKYFSAERKGRGTLYTFPEHKTFEPFSLEFLSNTEISSSEKSYIVAAQQLMYKDVEGFGKISYSDSELSRKINLDRHTIAKYNKSLEEKGFLTKIPVGKSDEIIGIKVDEKIFYLNKLGQKIIWILQKHEEDIQEVKDRMDKRDKDIELLLDRISYLEEMYKEQLKLNKAFTTKFNLSNIEVNDIKKQTQNEIQL